VVKSLFKVEQTHLRNGRKGRNNILYVGAFLVKDEKSAPMLLQNKLFCLPLRPQTTKTWVSPTSASSLRILQGMTAAKVSRS
jgi:hypothetical protein